MASDSAPLEPASRRKEIPSPTSRTNTLSRLPTKTSNLRQNDGLLWSADAPDSTIRARGSGNNEQNNSVGMRGASMPTVSGGFKSSLRSPTVCHQGMSGLEYYKDSSMGALNPRQNGAGAVAGKSSNMPVPHISTKPFPRANTLRRKPSLINTYVSQSRRIAPIQPTIDEAGTNTHPSSLLNADHPPLSASSSVTEFDDADSVDASKPAPMSLDHIYNNSFQPHISGPPPSITPSTRYSESPGAFSHITTPTSMSSYSSQITSSPGNKSSVFGMSPGDAGGLSSRSNASADTQGRIHSSVDEIQSQSRKAIPVYATKSTNNSVQTSTPISGRRIPRLVSSNYPPSKLISAESAETEPPTSHTKPSKIQSSPVFPPPELAHLMENSVRSQAFGENTPARPSRDGTPNLPEQDRSSPVIHSKLPALRSPFLDPRRTRSVEHESDAGPVGSSGGYQPQLTPRSQHLPQNETPTSNQMSTPVSRTVLRKPKPSESDNQTKSGVRFGFFSRKLRVEVESVEDDPSKLGKKGPMAGTGHEGYGKYAARRRSGGIVTANASSAQLPSITSGGSLDPPRGSISSSKSETEVDKFFLDRLQPVMIRGEGAVVDGHFVPNKTADSASSQTTVDGQSLPGSSIGSPKTFRTSDSSTDTHWHGSRPPTLPRTSDVKSNPISPGLENSDSDASHKASRLPARKGFFSSRSAGKISPHKPSNTLVSADKSTMSKSVRTHQDQFLALGTSQSQQESQPSTNLKKSAWHFFSKPRSTPKPTQSEMSSSRNQSPEKPSVDLVPVAVEPELSARSIAHYAMLDSQDQISIEDLDDIMREAEALQRDEDLAYEAAPTDLQEYSPLHVGGNELIKSALSSLDTSAPVSIASESTLLPQSPADSGYSESRELPVANTTDSTAPRPSRLAQVGRIPKVVSKRDRTRTLPDRSFSRPFAKAQPMPGLTKPKFGVTPSHTLFKTVANQAPELSEPLAEDDDSSIAITDNQMPISSQTEDDAVEEFISFPMRNNSDLSYSSSSGTMYVSAPTGVVSGAGTPMSDDEVWQEYDDLLDDILTPSSSNTVVQPRNRPDWYQTPLRQMGSVPTIEKADDPTPKVFHNDEKVDSSSPTSMRRSRLLAVLQLNSPTATAKYPSGLFPGDADRSLGALSKRRSSLPKSIRASIGTIRSSRSSDLRASMIARNVALVPFAEAQDTQSSHAENRRSRPESSANLRFGALMVSKWLSFGRVLFSPAHFEASKVSSERVLIIDGLGKDWSYWCALTYSNAEIYNLGPSPVDSTSRREIGGFKSLPNYRYISHAAPDAPFPFPKGFFATVVFRFPGITSEARYRSTLSECKRVLRPGGFLEISMLDLDLNSMGNRARRAVRSVKTRLQELDPDVCLQPPDDSMIRLLGSRGFENLNRCMVGLPAAGVVSDSRENSIDKDKKNLADLVKDESQESDDGITKMVAKVGRWWYTRSFERNILSSGDYSSSIWNDTALLKECEARETNLKLLICYAQKPMINKRRTVSL